jgi:hypothetical protein
MAGVGADRDDRRLAAWRRAHAFGKIAQGALRHDGVAARLEVPGALSGELELALRLANGTQFVVRGHALVASAAEGARLAPDLSC